MQARRTNLYGTAGLVLAIVAATLAFDRRIGYVAAGIAVLAVVLGLVGRSLVKRERATNNGVAVAAVSVGVVAAALAVSIVTRPVTTSTQASGPGRDTPKSAEEVAKDRATTPSTSSTPPSSTTTTTTTTPPEPTTTPPPAPKRVIAEFTGNGIKTTSKFTTTGPWELTFSFNCAKQSDPQLMSFMLSVEPGTGGGGPMPSSFDDVIIQMGDKTGGDKRDFDKVGEFRLSAMTMCSWAAVVRG